VTTRGVNGVRVGTGVGDEGDVGVGLGGGIRVTVGAGDGGDGVVVTGSPVAGGMKGSSGAARSIEISKVLQPVSSRSPANQIDANPYLERDMRSSC
jgi:hypothetical protein